MNRLSVQKLLQKELERLKQVTGMAQGLRVVWLPSADKPLSGEVKGEEVFIYELDEGKALQVLRHEVLDFIISQAILPYQTVVNALIKAANDEAYRRKERIVEALVRLIHDNYIQE